MTGILSDSAVTSVMTMTPRLERFVLIYWHFSFSAIILEFLTSTIDVKINFVMRTCRRDACHAGPSYFDITIE
jgi:hypothetical protein